MDQIAQRLEEFEWQYAPVDSDALEILKQRISGTGERFSLISYSDLVRGIDFHYPNINEGAAYRINTHDWSGLDRNIVGDCLGYISKESYLAHGFMASALVIGRSESKPSDMFFEWMEYLGALPDTKEATVLKFWSDQVRKAHHWYAYGKETSNITLELTGLIGKHFVR